MANQFLQHNITLIQFDDTKYRVNVSAGTDQRIEVVRLSDLSTIAVVLNFTIYWMDITGIVPTVLATNFVKITLP